jgi:hypothetical protein
VALYDTVTLKSYSFYKKKLEHGSRVLEKGRIIGKKSVISFRGSFCMLCKLNSGINENECFTVVVGKLFNRIPKPGMIRRSRLATALCKQSPHRQASNLFLSSEIDVHEISVSRIVQITI